MIKYDEVLSLYMLNDVYRNMLIVGLYENMCMYIEIYK